jgi:hypothetical protein
LNTKYAKEWPNISEKKDAMAEAEKWKDVEKKREHFDPAPQAKG